MSKISPLSAILSGFLSATKLQENFDKITAALTNTVSRDGSAPNNMQANLDMDSHRVINLGPPVNGTDAVRLQDIQGIVAGDITISADWADIADKPQTFPPDVHSHTAAQITDLSEAVQDEIGSHVKGGTNIVVTYDDTSGDTTINAAGSLAADWNTLLNKPTTFTPSAHNHAQSDVTGLTSALSAKANTSHTHVLADITDYTPGSGGGAFVTLEDFGGNGNGSFDNISAFSSAQSSTGSRVYLDGDYSTSGSPNSLVYDKFYGPGRIIFSGDYRPADFHNILTMPTKGTGVDLQYFYSGDTKKVNASYWKFGKPGGPLRVGLSEKYFESVTTPYFSVMQSYQGYSGTTCKTTNTISTGATTVGVAYTQPGGDDLPSGTTFAFASGQDGTIVHTATSLGVSGSTLSFTPAIPSSVSLPSGSFIFVGRRTMNPYQFVQLTHSGGGDAYGTLYRIIADYQPTKGQSHIFYTSTIGMIGGDMTATRDGNFMTGIEINHDGGVYDVGTVGLILNFQRNNDIGARGAFWTGVMIKSEGSKAITSGLGLLGKFNVGLDLACNTDFGTQKAAIAMKMGDRIHLNNTTTPRGDYSLNGDQFPASPMYIGSTTTGGVNSIELQNGSYRLRLNSDGGITTNAGLSVASNVLAGGYLQANVGSIYLINSNTGFEFDGSTVRLKKNGVVVASW